jgi:hypothetical protein
MGLMEVYGASNKANIVSFGGQYREILHLKWAVLSRAIHQAYFQTF